MGLSTYREKRIFSKTPEPRSGKGSAGKLHFVVQKHDASRLHYDLRLEMEGVLKSWAVPKGPSLNPADKRLAMMVEDHPMDYRRFEGTIPEGNYGAGEVIVWDEGYYTPLEPSGNKKKDNASLLRQLKKGSLKVVLHGKKLKGEFALVRLKQAENNAWLLIKHRDEYASTENITLSDKSVISGKPLAPKKKPRVTTNRKQKSIKTLTGKQKKPAFITPMLATSSTDTPPKTEEGWSYEIKWDGYRVVATCDKDAVHLYSRNKQLFDDRFYTIKESLEELNILAVLDGEVCVLNDEGRTHFGQLQNWHSEKDGKLVYYVFDLLELDGYPTTEIPLVQRRALLRDLLPQHTVIRFSEDFLHSDTDLVAAARELQLEGLMAKKSDSLYYPGERSKEWLKVKIRNRQEVVIGGFTRKKGSARTFSSLLAGFYKKGKLQYAGRIGTGFSDKLQRELMKKMKPLIVKESPYAGNPDINKSTPYRYDRTDDVITWLKPALIAEIAFAEITKDGLLRQASFEGLRDDKAAKKVVQEPMSAPMKSLRKSTGLRSKKETLLPVDADKKFGVKVSGQDLIFTNPGKIYWPADKITKGELINYYHNIAPFILPYLMDRPQSLYRFPNGIRQKGFYQKDVTDKVPEWIYQYPYTTDDGPVKHFMVPKTEADILFMANLGTIEMNPWSSTIHHPDHPTWCLLDLDPGTKSSFDDVIKVAQAIHDIFSELRIKSYVKTSGSTGLHIYLPLGEAYSYDESQLFAKLIATEAQRRTENISTIERAVRKRRGRLYIDYLQNRTAATLAAPYSVRPKPKAPVSMPLHWDEVKKGLSITDFTIKNAWERASKEGDIFSPVLGPGIDILNILSALSKPGDI